MHYKYLIIGGGMTADSAVTGIREIDKDGSIGVISSDVHPPYDRPPLTKALWKGEKEESVWRGTTEHGAELHLGRIAKTLDPLNKRIVDDENHEYTYDKLLLATGVSPRNLDFGGPGILYYRRFDDYKHLRDLALAKKRFAVIGGGFIGSELSASLAMNGMEPMLIFPGAGIGGNLFPADLSEFLNGYYREKGVQVLPHTSVFRCEGRDGGYVVGLRDKENERAWDEVVDGVIAGIGTSPNTELAESAGLEVVDHGIRVNPALQTSHGDIYAAGDVASYFDQTLQEWRRVEHEDNANTMGVAAGKSMAGESVHYNHLPFFYSDLFDLGYEAVGDVDSRLEMVADWKDPFREGVIYYLREGRVRGVLLWNVWDQVDAARGLIAEHGPFEAEDLMGRLPA